MTTGAVIRLSLWGVGLNQSGAFVGGDTAGYWKLAANPLEAYGRLDGSIYELALRRPPGYPTILAVLRVFGDSYTGAALFQALLGVVVIWLVVLLAREIVSPTAALIAGWWMALEPLHAVESSVLLTEIPFSIFILLAVLAVSQVSGRGFSWNRWALSGFLVGAATLIRPITLYLPALVVPLLWLVRPRRGIRWFFIVSGAFSLAFLLPVAGWVARNHAVSGVPILTTIEGSNIANYRAVGALAEGEDLTVPEARDRLDDLIDREARPGMNPAELSRVQTQVGIAVILEHPVGYVLSAVKGLVRTLLGPGSSHIRNRFPTEGEIGVPVTGLILVSAFSAFSMSILGGLGVLVWIRERSWYELSIISVPVAYLLIMGSGHEAYSRFRLPLMPLMSILASVGAIYAWTWVRRVMETRFATGDR